MTTNYNVPSYYKLPSDILIATGGSNITSLAKFGFTTEIGATEHTVWDGAANTDANLPASALQMKVSSDDAADTAAGTGARTVMLHGLDADYKEIQEQVTLSGVTPVTTTKSFLRMNRMMVLTAGSGGENAGPIYAYTGADTAGVPDTNTLIYAIVTAAQNQTLQCNYTVPASKICLMDFIEIINLGGNNAEVTVRLLMRPLGGVWNTKRKFVFESGIISRRWSNPLSIAAKTDIEVRAQRTSGSGTLSVSAELDMRLVPAG